MKRVAITGGAGFLGSHLCDHLLAEGNEVICVDNLLTSSISNITHLLKNPKFTFVEHDVIKEFEPSTLFQSLDAVLHFASPASPIDYLKYPIDTLKVGSLGTLNALNLAKRNSARFLLASTSEVYGDPEISPQPENYNGNVSTIGLRSVYDESKRFSESLTMAYFREFHLDSRIVRIFNTYGSRMRLDDGRIVSNFIVQALQNVPITMYGNGSQSRSLNYVDDTVRGILKILHAEKEYHSDAMDILIHRSNHGHTIHAPINIGNPRELTVLEIAQLIKRLTNSTSIIQLLPLPMDDPKQRNPDLRQAEALINYKSLIDLESGLKTTIEYFKAQLQQYSQQTTTTTTS